MTPGTPYGFKVCPECHRQNDLIAQICPGCGHRFRQQFVPPSPPGPQMPGTQDPTTAFYGYQNPTQAYIMPRQDPAEMARQFLEARKLCLWTFWLGLFCLWPLWIVTYMEYDKMRKLKEEIARMGLNVQHWQQSFGLRDLP